MFRVKENELPYMARIESLLRSSCLSRQLLFVTSGYVLLRRYSLLLVDSTGRHSKCLAYSETDTLPVFQQQFGGSLC